MARADCTSGHFATRDLISNISDKLDAHQRSSLDSLKKLIDNLVANQGAGAVGREMTYYAIPDNSTVFELAAISEDHGESLQFLDMYFSGQSRRNADGTEIDKLFYAAAQQLKFTSPGIESRKCYLDRYWDMLHFLLSAEYRQGAQTSEDYGSIAILGERDIHKNAVATQGSPLRHVSAATAMRIADWLNGISCADLKSHYNPDLMEAQAVYKFFKDRDCEEQFAWICKYFECLKKFFQNAAEHEEGVLIVCD